MPQKKKERHHLHISIPLETKKRLDKLTKKEESGSMTQVVINALKLLEFAQENPLYTWDEHKEWTEIILL